MAEKIKMTEEFKKEVDNFFKEGIKVYEAGVRPNEFNDRPFFKTLPDGITIFVGKDELSQDAFSISMGAKALSDAEKSSTTENSEYLKNIEERFRKVKPDAQFIIIDPDVVRDNYANDEDRKRNLFTSFAKYLGGRLQEEGRAHDFPLRVEDYYELMEASVTGNSPLSATMPTNPSAVNPKGDGQFSVVISSQPDERMHGMFADIIGCEQRLQAHKLTKRDVDEMILLHELGHALDQRNGDSKSFLDVNYHRHRTECVADAFSILQAARKDKHTAMGEVVADIRADNTAQGMAYVLNQVEQVFGGAQAGVNVDGIECSKEFAGRSHAAIPELKELVDLFGKKKALPKNKLLQTGENFQAPLEKEPTVEDAFNELYTANVEYQLISTTASIAAYRTTPTVDETCKIANEGLADGSLLSLSDKEVHKLAEDIVDRTALPKEKFAALCYGVITGQATPELVEIGKRNQEAVANFPDDPEKRMAQQMVAQGIPNPKEQMTQKDMNALVQWRRDLELKVKEEGASKKDLLKVIGKEKDEVRSETGILRDYKISLMNEEFLKESTESTKKARAIATVENSIEKTSIPEVKVTGAKAVAKYVSSELSALVAAEKYADKNIVEDRSEMGVEEIVKSANENAASVKKIIKAEKTAQEVAKVILKDKGAMEIVSKSPLLLKRIEAKSEGKHPEWIDDTHLTLASKNVHKVEDLEKVVSVEKRNLAVVSMASKEVVSSLTKSTKDKLSKFVPKSRLKKKVASKLANKQKANPFADPGQMQWNALKGSSR